MNLELFQTTVNEYKRFAQQLPINYSGVLSGNISDSDYVASQTRLMLLRKYTRSQTGNLLLSAVLNEAIKHFPEHKSYFVALKKRFNQSCEQSLTHILANGTNRTLDATIDDTMYGLHLHADEERIRRIAQDDESLRIYCVVIFVKEIESLVLELYDFFKNNGVSCIENDQHLHAPVIHLEAQSINAQRVEGSEYWSNIIGSDISEEADCLTDLINKTSFEDRNILIIALSFAELLIHEPFSREKMLGLVHPDTISEWGDFSEIIACYKKITSPGFHPHVRYNENHDMAYIHVFPNVEVSFSIHSEQIVSGVYMITLAKENKSGTWKVFSFGGSTVL